MSCRTYQLREIPSSQRNDKPTSNTVIYQIEIYHHIPDIYHHLIPDIYHHMPDIPVYHNLIPDVYHHIYHQIPDVYHLIPGIPDSRTTRLPLVLLVLPMQQHSGIDIPYAQRYYHHTPTAQHTHTHTFWSWFMNTSAVPVGSMYFSDVRFQVQFLMSAQAINQVQHNDKSSPLGNKTLPRLNGLRK